MCPCGLCSADLIVTGPLWFLFSSLWNGSHINWHHISNIIGQCAFSILAEISQRGVTLFHHSNTGGPLMLPSVHFGSTGCFRGSTGGWSGNTQRQPQFPCWPRRESRERVPRKASRMRSSWPRRGPSDNTRLAWRRGCRSWKTTTNSWSPSCAGWGSCCYR